MGETRTFFLQKPAPPSVLKRLRLPAVLLAGYAGAVALLDWLFHDFIKAPLHVHTFLGAVLGLLLVFRTNTAYDRWWEGRKLWGQLVNDSRNLCLKIRALPAIPLAEARHLGRLLTSFARALKEHLREGVRAGQLSLYGGNVRAEPTHVPIHLASLVRGQIAGWRREGRIDGFDDLLLDRHARSLTEVCGACERIRKTPISPSYRTFLRQCIMLYLVTLPWGLVDELSFWVVPAVTIITYFMLGLELIAEDVEEPFGRGEDDLELDEICRGLEASVEEILAGEESQAPDR